MNQEPILLVLADDEAFIRLAYKEGLERAGYRVEVAEDGEAALELVSRLKPKLVMLDLMMPKLNGFNVLKRIKADPALQSIPVVILSNLSQPGDEAEAAENGAMDFLVKSDHSMEQVTDKVGQWLSLVGNQPAAEA